jgi:hypothetical protein
MVHPAGYLRSIPGRSFSENCERDNLREGGVGRIRQNSKDFTPVLPNKKKVMNPIFSRLISIISTVFF